MIEGLGFRYYWATDGLRNMEISNISLNPRDLIDTHNIMTLILKYSDS